MTRRRNPVAYALGYVIGWLVIAALLAVLIVLLLGLGALALELLS